MITTQSPAYRQIEKGRMSKRQRIRGNKKPIWNILKAGDWANEKCFIIGGGPSLRNFDFERLRGKGRLIAVNKSFFDVPFADCMLFMDKDFPVWAEKRKLAKGEIGRKYAETYKNFEGIKLFVDMANSPVNNVYFIHRINSAKYSNNLKNGIYAGNNSGVAALSFAAAMGCNPIYLLGMDGGHSGKRSHYHSGYPERIQHESTAKSFINHFERLGQQLKQKGFMIYNLSLKSRINKFVKMDPNKII